MSSSEEETVFIPAVTKVILFSFLSLNNMDFYNVSIKVLIIFTAWFDMSQRYML